MTFNVYKTSEYSYNTTTEINTLEDLQRFQNENGTYALIVDFNDKSIEIYDGLRE